MNLKNKLNSLNQEYSKTEKTLADLNADALTYMKSALESAARRGKTEFSFRIIKLVYGPNYQIQSGEEDAIELTNPRYLMEELQKDGLEASLLPKLDGTKNWTLTCKW